MYRIRFSYNKESQMAGLVFLAISCYDGRGAGGVGALYYWNSRHLLQSGYLLEGEVILLRTLSRDNDGANKNYTQKLHSRFLNKFTLISTHLVCVIWPNFSGDNAVGVALKFRKRNEN